MALAVLPALFLWLSPMRLRAEPAAPAPSEVADMEPEAFAGLLGRLSLNPDDFGVEKPAKPAPKAGEKPNEPAKKEEDDLTAENAEDAEAVETARREALTPEEREAEDTAAEEARVAALTPEEKAAEEAAAAAENAPAELKDLGLTAEQLAAVSKHLEAVTATGDKEAVAKLTTDLKAAQENAAALAAELVAKAKTPVAVVDLHPVMRVTDPEKLAARERELMNFEEWAVDNWDGSEAVEAHGNTPAVPAYSPAQVRARYSEIKQEREYWIPRARAVMAEQQRQDAVARQAYPELFKDKSPENTVMQGMLAAAPGLATVFPNARMIIGDALVGEQLRVGDLAGLQKLQAKLTARIAAAKAAGTKAATKPAGGGAAAATKPAPKVPMGARPSKPATAGARKAADTIDEKAFAEMGGTRDALVKLIGQTSLVNN